MSQNFKKFLISLISTSIFATGIYFLVNFYDKSGNSTIRIQQNLYYLIFLFVSIVICLTLIGEKNKKNNFIISFLILINFLYIIFLFGTSNIGLNTNQGYILIGLLILAFVGVYIKNRIGGTITTLSIVFLIGTFISLFIPLYENGPDIEGFNNSFKTQLLTYSKASLNGSKVYVQLDKKEFQINNQLSSYDIKINNSGSQLLFKSNKKYLNTFAYIVFPNQEFIEIHPQSAININKDYMVEIITGTIKYFPQGHKWFSFTGKTIPSLVVNEESLNNINGYYEGLLKEYIIQNIGLESFVENKNIFQISEFIVNTLAKILPKQFKNNLKNLEDYKKYLNITFEENYKTGFDDKKIQKDLLKNLRDGLNSTKTAN